MRKTTLIATLFLLACTLSSAANDTIPDLSRLTETSDILQSLGIDIDNPPQPSRTQTAKVGTAATSFDVSPTGGALWQMSFDVPPGVGGMTPQMGLTYNSQGGMGIAGWGVNVSGLSVITRGAKSLYYDSSVRGIAYDSHDALYLDGVRLLLASGTEGVTGAVYHPEGDPFTSVTVKSGSTASGPVWFEVKTPDGMTLRYGYTSSSRLSVTVSGTVRNAAWYVSRRQDPNGNYMEFSYTKSHYVAYPATVTYGMNANATTGSSSTIEFNYDTLPDSQFRYFAIGGKTGYVGKRIASVVTKTGSTVYRQYALTYDSTLDGTAKKYPRLVSVSVLNGQGEAMNPVTLGWSGMPTLSKVASVHTMPEVSEPSTLSVEDSVLVAADLNGDGLSDVIRFSNVNWTDDGSRYYGLYAYVHLTDSDDGELTFSNPLKIRFTPGIGRKIYGRTNYAGIRTVLDFNGDGTDDLLIPYIEDCYGSLSYRVEYALGSDTLHALTHSRSFTIPLTDYGSMPLYIGADVSGDGRDEAMFLETESSGDAYRLHFVFLRDDGTENWAYTDLQLPETPEWLFAGDYNDDGLTDLIVLFDGGHRVFFNNGGSSVTGLFSSFHSLTGASFEAHYRTEQGDFNGDGRLDFLYVARNSDEYRFALNNGDGTFSVILAAEYGIHDQGGVDEDDDRFSVIPIDIDHDGMTDVVIAKACYEHHGGLSPWNEYTGTLVGWVVSDGTSLTERKRVSSIRQEDARACNLLIGDFDGDGYPELMNWGADYYTYATAPNDGCHLRRYSTVGLTPGSGKVTSMTDGLGQRTDVSYATMADTETYGHRHDAAYPLADLHAPLHVVRYADIPVGATAQRHTYRYGGMVVHRRGKGLLGFRYREDSNSASGMVSYSSVIEWDSLRFVPKVTRSGVEADGCDAYERMTMQITASGGNNFYSRPLYKREADYDGFETKTTYWHDSYGRLFDELTEYDLLEDWDMHTRTRYISFVKKGGRWLPTKVMKRMKHRDDPTQYDVYTLYTYDDRGNPTQVTSNWDTPLELITFFTYDAFGNVTSSHATGGEADFTEYTEYDSTGRFPVRRWQSPGGMENTYTRDAWGGVLTATDATEPGNPLTTTYTRDGWGDVVTETDPTGLTVAYSSGWGLGGGYCLWYADALRPGSAAVRTWYDGSGREARREEKGQGGTDIYTMTSYDRFGEVANTVRLTQLGATTSRTEVSQTLRDARGRVTREWCNTGAYTGYVYGDRSVTATDQSGRSTTTDCDAWGNTVRTEDAMGNTVEYAYSSCGKPSQVTVTAADNTASVVSMEYDAAGNRTVLDDPDAGEMTYEWSADSRLLSSTDARGCVTVNAYDSLGRLTQTVTDSIATTYTYGTSGHGTHRLVSESRGGLTLSYAYDQYGRISSVTRDYGGGTALTHGYVYDAYGRLVETDYPSGLEAYYIYDGNGFMDGIQTNHNGDAWNLLSYDGLTMRSEVGTDGLHAVSVNDQWGRLTERYAIVGSGTDKLFRLAFTYDSLTCNVTSRTGVDGTGVTVQFTYDSLDRLTSAGSETYTYAANGNILAKTGMGSYAYSSSKPHAVTHVGNTSGRMAEQTAAYDGMGRVTSVSGIGTGGPGYLSPLSGGTGAVPESIIPGHGNTVIGWGDRYDVAYGPDGERWRTSYRDTTVVFNNGSTSVRTLSRRDILYAGDYERVTDKDGTVREYHYLGQGVIAVVTDGGDASLYLAVTDNVGSYVHLVNAATGAAAFSVMYDPWGRMTRTAGRMPFHRGYGGHEMLAEFGLVNMNGRMYDFNTARFLSPDEYVQLPHDSQSFNRYSYCLNNPLKYTDPSGKVWWIPIVAGALIGGAISGASYAVSVGITGGTWNGRDFLKSIGMGAFAGALSAGMGQASAALGISKVTANTVGYKLFSQITNSVATNAVFGNSMDWSDVAGIAVSSFVATKLPDYKATDKGLFSNFIGETVHNTLAGATTGFVQGATKSLIKNDARYLFENTMGGAMSGFSRTVVHNALLGSPYKTHPAYDKSSGIIRRGGVFGLFANRMKDGENMGITLGRNSYSVDGNLYTSAHESYHLSDIERMGWAAFYSRIISEYFKYGFNRSYNQPGTLEYNAKIYGLNVEKILSPPEVIMPDINFPF